MVEVGAVDEGAAAAAAVREAEAPAEAVEAEQEGVEETVSYPCCRADDRMLQMRHVGALGERMSQCMNTVLNILSCIIASSGHFKSTNMHLSQNPN